MWLIGVKVEQETSAPPPKRNPGSAPGLQDKLRPHEQGVHYQALLFIQNISPFLIG